VKREHACPTDLEAIVTCLEISAINLTPKPNSVFTARADKRRAVALPEMTRPTCVVLDHYPPNAPVGRVHLGKSHSAPFISSSR